MEPTPQESAPDLIARLRSLAASYAHQEGIDARLLLDAADALADREAAIKEGLERADRVIKSALFSHEEKEIARNIAEALTGRRRGE